MKILKKIMCWNSDLTASENLLLIFYRIFTYLVPSGMVIWSCVIDKLLDDEITLAQKLGCSGLVVLVACVIIAVVFLGRHFTKTIKNLNDKILICTDDAQKKELVANRKQVEKWQATFKNACFVAPFIVGLIVVNLLESKILSLRGSLTVIVISLCTGFGFNTVAQELIAKNK